MREIKFRALAKDGTWRYGEYPHSAPEMSNTHYPMDIFWNSFLITFRRETLGEYTGLKDKQGKKIFEGDIIDVGGGHWLREVILYEGAWAVRCIRTDDGPRYTYPYITHLDQWEGEVIGNVYQDSHLLEPELLKESDVT